MRYHIVAASMLLTFVIFSANCSSPDDGEERLGEDGEQVLMKPCTIAPGKDLCVRAAVYVRYAPHGSAYDFFMWKDVLEAHYEMDSGQGMYVCATGATRYGERHTGWIRREYLHADKEPPLYKEDQTTPVCQYNHSGLTAVALDRRCTVDKNTKFLYGPSLDAEYRDITDSNPTIHHGEFEPGTRIGLVTDSQGGPRDHVINDGVDYAWFWAKTSLS
jgi:hypothetical protein